MRRIAALAFVLSILATAFGLWLGKYPWSRLPRPKAQIQPDETIASKSLAPSTGPATNFASQEKQTALPPKVGTAASSSAVSGQTTSRGTAAPANDSQERLSWETNFLVRLRGAAEGDPLQFPLPGSRTAFG